MDPVTLLLNITFVAAVSVTFRVASTASVIVRSPPTSRKTSCVLVTSPLPVYVPPARTSTPAPSTFVHTDTSFVAESLIVPFSAVSVPPTSMSFCAVNSIPAASDTTGAPFVMLPVSDVTLTSCFAVTAASSATPFVAVTVTLPFVEMMGAVFLKLPPVVAVTLLPAPTVPPSVMSPVGSSSTVFAAPIVPASAVVSVPSLAWTETASWTDATAAPSVALVPASICTAPFVAVTEPLPVFSNAPAASSVALLPALTSSRRVMSPPYCEVSSTSCPAVIVPPSVLCSAPFRAVSFASPVCAITAAFTSTVVPAVTVTSVAAVTVLETVAPAAAVMSTKPFVAVTLAVLANLPPS